jgi:hypothetical protein
VSAIHDAASAAAAAAIAAAAGPEAAAAAAAAAVPAAAAAAVAAAAFPKYVGAAVVAAATAAAAATVPDGYEAVPGAAAAAAHAVVWLHSMDTVSAVQAVETVITELAEAAASGLLEPSAAAATAVADAATVAAASSAAILELALRTEARFNTLREGAYRLQQREENTPTVEQAAINLNQQAEAARALEQQFRGLADAAKAAAVKGFADAASIGAAAAAKAPDAARLGEQEQSSSVQSSESRSSSMVPAAEKLTAMLAQKPADPSKSPDFIIPPTPSPAAAAAASASPPITAVPKEGVPSGTLLPTDAAQSTATPGQLNLSMQDFMSFALAVWVRGPKLTDPLTRFGDDDVACVAYLRHQLRYRRHSSLRDHALVELFIDVMMALTRIRVEAAVGHPDSSRAAAFFNAAGQPAGGAPPAGGGGPTGSGGAGAGGAAGAGAAGGASPNAAAQRELLLYMRTVSDHVVREGDQFDPLYTGALVTEWQPEALKYKFPISLVWMYDGELFNQRSSAQNITKWQQGCPLLPMFTFGVPGDGDCTLLTSLLADRDAGAVVAGVQDQLTQEQVQQVLAAERDPVFAWPATAQSRADLKDVLRASRKLSEHKSHMLRKLVSWRRLLAF